MNNLILFVIALLFYGLQIGHAQNSEHRAMNMTPKQPTDIFIGAVMDSKSLNGDKYEFVETPFADVKISTPIPGVRSKIIVPAYERRCYSSR